MAPWPTQKPPVAHRLGTTGLVGPLQRSFAPLAQTSSYATDHRVLHLSPNAYQALEAWMNELCQLQ